MDCEEGWCFWTVVLEKTLVSPVDCKDIQPIHSKGDQPWDFFGRNDAKAETPVLWPLRGKSWLIGKDSDAGRDWGQEEKGTTGWDGWMASLTQWKWVWVNSVSWWWTGRSGVLQFMGSQTVGHDWVTDLNWTELKERIICQNHSFHVHLTSLPSVKCSPLPESPVKFAGNWKPHAYTKGWVIFSELSKSQREFNC